MQVKSRHHLRSDEVDRILAAIEEALGVTVEGDAFEWVTFDDADRRVVLVDGEPHVALFESLDADTDTDAGANPGAGGAGFDGGEPFLTVTGANAFPPTRRTVTVDAGAVSFVSDGANVMRPGIVAADDAIEAGDLVVVDEETHGKALAVGRADVPGDEMRGDSGKVVGTLHHVGDDLYELSV